MAGSRRLSCLDPSPPPLFINGQPCEDRPADGLTMPLTPQQQVSRPTRLLFATRGVNGRRSEQGRGHNDARFPSAPPRPATREKVMPVSFQTLWRNHPRNRTPAVDSPCVDAKGSPAYQNQCAIRISVCLHASGVGLGSFRGAMCWHNHGRRHILRAEQMGAWLRTSRIFGETHVRQQAPRASLSSAAYSSLRGIILFRNFWGRGNQGDHIDLWFHNRMPGVTDLSFFPRSEEIWFWSVN